MTVGDQKKKKTHELPSECSKKNLLSAETLPQKVVGTAFPARVQRDYQEASSHGHYSLIQVFSSHVDTKKTV